MPKLSEQIVAVNSEHVASIHQFIERIYQSTKVPIGGQWGYKSVACEVRIGQGLQILRENQPIALLFYRDAAAEGLDITFLGVDPQLMRRGLMTQLMDRLEGSSRGQRVVVEVHEKNAPALGFYDKRGFERVGLRKNYYRDGAGALLLAKDILQ